MTIRSINLIRGAVGAAALIALAAGPAAAHHLDQPLGADAITCRAAIAKFYGKVLATTGKTLTTCHKLRNLGKNTVTDCNNYPADSLNIDPKGKIAKAGSKLLDAVTSSCVGTTELLSSDYYLSCPEPCGTDLSLQHMTTLAQVGACLACSGPRQDRPRAPRDR